MRMMNSKTLDRTGAISGIPCTAGCDTLLTVWRSKWLGKNSPPPASFDEQTISSGHHWWPLSMDPSAFSATPTNSNHSFSGRLSPVKSFWSLALAHRLTSCLRISAVEKKGGHDCRQLGGVVFRSEWPGSASYESMTWTGLHTDELSGCYDTFGFSKSMLHDQCKCNVF
jgi:hypothetical protein